MLLRYVESRTGTILLILILAIAGIIQNASNVNVWIQGLRFNTRAVRISTNLADKTWSRTIRNVSKSPQQDINSGSVQRNIGRGTIEAVDRQLMDFETKVIASRIRLYFSLFICCIVLRNLYFDEKCTSKSLSFKSSHLGKGDFVKILFS